MVLIHHGGKESFRYYLGFHYFVSPLFWYLMFLPKDHNNRKRLMESRGWVIFLFSFIASTKESRSKWIIYRWRRSVRETKQYGECSFFSNSPFLCGMGYEGWWSVKFLIASIWFMVETMIGALWGHSSGASLDFWVDASYTVEIKLADNFELEVRINCNQIFINWAGQKWRSWLK